MMEGKDHAVDRISDLPCSLLTHILSFLHTKEAVQTCILSKRWTNVWALSVLRLDDRKFNEAAKSEEEYRECEAKFLRFVDAVFNHREIQPLVMFSLSWKGRSRDQVFKVLCRGVKCMPRVISISVYTYAIFDLPASIFTSVSVEEMLLSVRNGNNRSRRLFRSYHILGNCPEPKSINLPFLKKLELGDMEINDTFIVMTLSGCPLLEELVMNRCSLDVREISSDKLKKLALNECFLYRKTQILCPGVVSLRIRCRDRRGITFKNMSSLANADVYFQAVDFNSKGYSNYHNLKLVGGLSNVTSLRLHMISYFELDKLVEERSNSPPFNNLTSLTLKIEFNPSIYDWCLVDWFLQHSPNLKKLTLHFSRPIKDALEQKILRVLSIEREYLETVVIVGHEDISTKLAGDLVSTLGTLVKKIGRITVDLSLTSTKLAGDLAFALDARGRVLNWLLLD